MKKLLLTTLTILAGLSLLAQAPQSFSYQAVLRNVDGSVIANQQATVVVEILSGTTDGPPVFTETHSVTTTAQGIITMTIGSIEDLSVVDWASDSYYLKITVNDVVLGVTQLLSVPYALHANTASSTDESDPIFSAWDKTTGIQISVSQISDLQIQVDSISNYFDLDNAVTGDLLMFNGEKWVIFTPTYLTSFSESDPVFVAWNKSTGIVITESQISDLKNYLTDISNQSIGTLQDVDLTGLGTNKIL